MRGLTLVHKHTDYQITDRGVDFRGTSLSGVNETSNDMRVTVRTTEGVSFRYTSEI